MSASLTQEQLEKIEENRRVALAKRKAVLAAQAKAQEVVPNDGYSTPPPPPANDNEQDKRAVGFRSPVIHQISPNKSQIPLLCHHPERSIDPSKAKTCRHIKNPETGEICGYDKIDQQLYEGFQELVCLACRLNNAEMYGLLSKQECMKQYLLPEDTFQLFKCISKPNPHNSGWMPMKLYLRKQIESYALVRHGSWENLEKERQKREEQKFQKTLAKTEQLMDEKLKEFKNLIQQQKSAVVDYSLDEFEKPPEEELEKEKKAKSTSASNLLDASKNLKGKRQLSSKQQQKLTKKQKFLNNFLPSLLGDQKNEED